MWFIGTLILLYVLCIVFDILKIGLFNFIEYLRIFKVFKRFEKHYFAFRALKMCIPNNYFSNSENSKKLSESFFEPLDLLPITSNIKVNYCNHHCSPLILLSCNFAEPRITQLTTFRELSL